MTAVLKLYQGDDYAAVVDVTDASGLPADLTGYTTRAQIRRDVADKEPEVAGEFEATISGSRVSLKLGHTVTVTLAGRYLWDLQMVAPDGTRVTLLAGLAEVTQQVTRNGAVP